MANAGDFVVAVSQTVMALCALALGFLMIAAVLRNHLNRGFRPVLSALAIHAVAACMNYSILATNRWEHILYKTQMTPLPFDTIITNTVNAGAWLWLLLAFAWNYDIARMK